MESIGFDLGAKVVGKKCEHGALERMVYKWLKQVEKMEIRSARVCEYNSPGALELLQMIGLKERGYLKFQGNSVFLEGYIGMGRTPDSLLVIYVLHPDLDDAQLWQLLFKNLTRQASLTDLVNKACPLADSLGITVPDHFLCPITMDVMRDPMKGSDGHTYDCSAIATWLSKRPRSPLTNMPMRTSLLRMDIDLREEIEGWCSSILAHADGKS